MYLRVGFTQVDYINSGTAVHVVWRTQLTPCLSMLWRLQKPRHQQAWYWSPMPEYYVSSIRKVNKYKKVTVLLFLFIFIQFFWTGIPLIICIINMRILAKFKWTIWIFIYQYAEFSLLCDIMWMVDVTEGVNSLVKDCNISSALAMKILD